jgi:hypothetical protein
MMNHLLHRICVLGLSIALSFCGLSLPATAMIAQNNDSPAGKIFRAYKGVSLGLKREQVQAALGKPENSNANLEDYIINGNDTITVHYENDEVKAIQLMFLEAKNAPAWKEVVGEAEIMELANGAKTSRKVFAAEKFWVSIYQNKEGSMIRITISR